MKILAIIPIRSGSKSIKNKNIKKIHNKPLFYYSLKACIESKIFDEIVLSSDSPKYLKLVKKYFKYANIICHHRSKKNSTDQASTESVLSEVIKARETKQDTVCYLVQSTTPLVLSEDIINAYNLFRKDKLDSLFTSYEKKIFLWQKKKRLKPINYNFLNRPRRQNFKSCYFENGAFYIFKIKKFKTKKNRLFGKIGTYVMPESRSLEVDEKKDFLLLRKLMRN